MAKEDIDVVMALVPCYKGVINTDALLAPEESLKEAGSLTWLTWHLDEDVNVTDSRVEM